MFEKKELVKRIVSRFLLLFVPSFFFPAQDSKPLTAQTLPKIKITGVIIEENSGQSIPDVDIFLSNTTLTSFSDKNGNYSILDVPLGIYQLVASKRGYELEIVQFRLSEPKDLVLILKLRISKTEPIQEKTDIKKLKDGKEIIRLFEMNFLGTSNYSKKCNILNWEALEFEFDKNTKVLKAQATAPLEIENTELGYRIVYFLTNFYAQGIFTSIYNGYAKFVQFPLRNEKEKKKWDKNRQEVYKGSFKHFLTALTKNQAKDQGFLMFNVTALTEKYSDIYLKEIHEDAIIQNGETEFEKKLSFSDYIKVIYKFAGESREFTQYADQNPNVALEFLKSVRPEGTRLEEQISAIYLSIPTVTINSLGQIYNPLGITIFGYWSWENKIATTLPYNYEPN